ncbi:hypothetical protein BpHYR1_033736 [Brachionus plicatilis]|uniref:Uncharacterized protein n=1 Tax=Brachionus plicatilis TaxID=10195 RepID=A0A3M7RMV7_BRAPC|nr:hypothetical protein BpHYR1_033736 [Brachionus plicatilis]
MCFHDNIKLFAAEGSLSFAVVRRMDRILIVRNELYFDFHFFCSKLTDALVFIVIIIKNI